MDAHGHDPIQHQLQQRRSQLVRAATSLESPPYLLELLAQVDAALGRIASGNYGLCETCGDPIETDRLMADPLERFCIDHLTTAQQRAMEQDLQLSAKIQAGLLPPAGLCHGVWATAYHFEAAGPVSGDYVDLVPCPNGSLFFAVGDVSGKGVAASMLMSHLSAMFRTLLPFDMPLQELLARASRVFCESTLPSHYATLACGLASPEGSIEICNAGHVPPILLGLRGARPVETTGLPLGLFCQEEFGVKRFELARGEALLLYTDGATEARNPEGEEYGSDRLSATASPLKGQPPSAVIQGCREDLRRFTAGSTLRDDMTMLLLRRED